MLSINNKGRCLPIFVGFAQLRRGLFGEKDEKNMLDFF